MRVLLVEPDDGIRSELSDRLLRDGCTVRLASTAWDALAMLQEDPLPDVVAMDFGCPEGCADWLVREARADERLARLRVVPHQEAVLRATAARRIARLRAIRPARLGAFLEHIGRLVWRRVES